MSRPKVTPVNTPVSRFGGSAVIAAIAVLSLFAVAFGGAAPASAAAATASITGQVYLGDSAHPASGVVTVEWRDGATPSVVGGSAVTDPQGAFTLTGVTSSYVYLYIRYTGTDDYPSQWYDESPADLDPDLGVATAAGRVATTWPVYLYHRADVTGHITLGTGGRAAGSGEVRATLTARRSGHDITRYTVATALTDAHGDYALRSVPSSSFYTIRFDYLGSDAFTGADYAPGGPGTGVVLGSGTGVTASWTLPALHTLTGIVRHADTGTPVGAGEATVRLKQSNAAAGTLDTIASVATAANGSYTFTRVSDGPSSTYLAVDYAGSDHYAGLTDQWVRLPAGAPTLTTDLALPVTYSVSGRVTLGRAGASPAAGSVRVDVLSGSKVAGTGTVDGQGRWTVAGLLASSYAVRATYVAAPGVYADAFSIDAGCDQRFSFCPSEVRVVGPTTGIDLVLRDDNELAGTVRGPDLLPVGATVYADRLAGDSSVTEETVHTGADGRYVLSGLPIGDYVISYLPDSATLAPEAWQDRNLYREPTIVRVGAVSSQYSMDVRLSTAGALSGTLSSEWLTPADLARGRVTASLWISTAKGDASDWTYTGETVEVGADGSYGFDGLLPDLYLVQIEYTGPRGYLSQLRYPLTVNDGQTLDASLALELPVWLGGVDFTGDGDSDVLAVDSTGKLRQYRGDGSGRIVGSSVIGSGWNGFAKILPVADFSGDGESDLLAIDKSGGLWLYRGNGNGGFAGSGKKIGTGWNGFDRVFSPGDFDGDGHDDVIARTPAGKLFLYRGNGSGGWAASGRQIGSGWNGFTAIIPVGDFDGDGAVDVLARTAAGKLSLYSGNGVGGWLGSWQVGSGWSGFTFVGAAGDFDSDAASDVIARDSTGRLWLYSGDGAGGWLGRTQIGSGWSSLAIVG